jgi:hypothetical protein
MNKELKSIIDDNAADLLKGYESGMIDKQDIENLLVQAMEDEEFEVCESIKLVLSMIKQHEDK